MIGTKIHITGIVQGVGFRPFVYNQAPRQGLTGWVCNSSAGVDIEVNGEPLEITTFIQSLKADFPPLARIDSFEYHQIPPNPYKNFEIIQSMEVSEGFQLVPGMQKRIFKSNRSSISCPTHCLSHLWSSCLGGTFRKERGIRKKNCC